jgi:hypothetical protein
VRIQYSTGYWRVEPVGEGKNKIIYENHSDPAGSLPAWLTNSSVVNIPFKTLEKMRVIVKRKQYQGKSYALLGKS